MSAFYPRGQSFGWVQSDPPCPAPTLAVASIDPTGGVTLEWSGGANACGYAVFQGTEAGEESYLAPVQNTDPDTFTVEVTGLTPGGTYFFTLKSLGCNGQGYGCASNEVSAFVGTIISYAGFATSLIPDAAQVAALQEYTDGQYAGTYVLEQSSGQSGYPCFWFPTSIGMPSKFVFNGFTYYPFKYSLTVNGVAGNMYVLPIAQTLLTETWVVS
jgi:hypothetical protein